MQAVDLVGAHATYVKGYSNPSLLLEGRLSVKVGVLKVSFCVGVPDSVMPQ